MKTIIKVTAILLIMGFLSCNVETFDKEKYKGYVYIKPQDSTWRTHRKVVLSGKDKIETVKVPVWFTDVYSVGDTIK